PKEIADCVGHLVLILHRRVLLPETARGRRKRHCQISLRRIGKCRPEVCLQPSSKSSKTRGGPDRRPAARGCRLGTAPYQLAEGDQRVPGGRLAGRSAGVTATALAVRARDSTEIESRKTRTPTTQW